MDMPVEPLGARGEHCVQTCQTRHGTAQFHLLVPGLPKFDEAEAQAVTKRTEGKTRVRCVSGAHLLASKLAANRAHDHLDVEFLMELRRLGKL